MQYPFEPKSNAHLQAGQFWAVPLVNGAFACGRVLAVPRERDDPNIPVSSRIFLAGLHGWVGDQPPTADAIADAPILDQGFAHVLTVRETGGAILGYRSPDLDALVPLLWLDQNFGREAWVYRGAERVRSALPTDSSLPVMSTWGFRVITVLAERRFRNAGRSSD